MFQAGETDDNSVCACYILFYCSWMIWRLEFQNYPMEILPTWREFTIKWFIMFPNNVFKGYLLKIIHLQAEKVRHYRPIAIYNIHIHIYIYMSEEVSPWLCFWVTFLRCVFSIEVPTQLLMSWKLSYTVDTCILYSSTAHFWIICKRWKWSTTGLEVLLEISSSLLQIVKTYLKQLTKRTMWGFMGLYPSGADHSMVVCIYVRILYVPWKSKTKQRMVFRMIHVKDSLLPMGKVWSLDFRGIYIYD